MNLEKNKSHRERYYYRKTNRICTRCGVRPARSNRTLCLKCQILHDKISKKSLKKRLSENPELHLRKKNQTNQSLFKYRTKLRNEVLNLYGGKCQCCGETEPMFLAIDHVNNDGAIDRKTMWGTPYYQYLLKLGKSNRYQILCHNCNWGKRLNKGICPHKTK